jgi:hypothetical protein
MLMDSGIGLPRMLNVVAIAAPDLPEETNVVFLALCWTAPPVFRVVSSVPLTALQLRIRFCQVNRWCRQSCPSSGPLDCVCLFLLLERVSPT